MASPFSDIEEGALHEDLGVAQEENIPDTLLRKIRSANIGDTIENPSETGRQRIKVTNKLKQRVNFALNFGG